MVGARCAEDLVTAIPGCQVTVLGREQTPAYNRVLLSSVVAGTKSPDTLNIAGPDREGLTVLTGTSAVSIHRDDHTIVDDKGVVHPYDALILATGSSARIPPLQGLGDDKGLAYGVFVLKDVDDADRIVAATRKAKHAVVLGAGVLGLEVATGLVQRDVQVRLVQASDRLMDRHLGWEASEIAVGSLRRLGIESHTGASIAGVETRRGVLRSVRLADGSTVPADIFVMCTGTVPETRLAREAGLMCGRGITVNCDLRTNDDRIFAIGDCAEPAEGSTGLVAQGWSQACRLVDVLAGRPTVAASGSVDDVVRVKTVGMSLVSMGVSGDFDRSNPQYRVLSLKDPERDRFVEVVVAGGRLVGATCLGDAQVGATLSALYTRGLPVPDDPALLMVRALSGGGAAVVSKAPENLADDDTVCNCNSVCAGQIREATQRGCITVADVGIATRAGTGCGDCMSTIGDIVRSITSHESSGSST